MKKILLVLFLIFILFFWSQFIPVVVCGNSMLPTLQDKELILMERGNDHIKEGSLVLFKNKEAYVIKRVIAIGPKTVEIDYDQNIVLVDDVIISENYVMPDDDIMKVVNGRAYEIYHVPDETVFVLGDNRNDSLDSRFSGVGCIDKQSVIGHLNK